MYTPIETYRGFVYPWHVDQVGHLNVQFYTARFDEATWHFLNRLGLSPTHFKRSGRSAVAADQRTQYKREVHGGSLLHVTTELLELGRKSLRFMHRMYDTETGEEVASTELVGVYFDTTRRVSAELPGFVHDHAVGLTAHSSHTPLTPIADRLKSLG
jgi:acyl-CoA thioester hydrolase